MICILRNARKLWTLCRSAGKELQCHAADGFCGIQIDRNANISRQGLVHIFGKINGIAGIVDEIMSVDPCFSSADCDLQPRRCGCQLEAVTVIVLNSVTDDAAEVVAEILRGIGAVKTL